MNKVLFFIELCTRPQKRAQHCKINILHTPLRILNLFLILKNEPLL